MLNSLNTEKNPTKKVTIDSGTSLKTVEASKTGTRKVELIEILLENKSLKERLCQFLPSADVKNLMSINSKLYQILPPPTTVIISSLDDCIDRIKFAINNKLELNYIQDSKGKTVLHRISIIYEYEIFREYFLDKTPYFNNKPMEHYREKLNRMTDVRREPEARTYKNYYALFLAFKLFETVLLNKISRQNVQDRMARELEMRTGTAKLLLEKVVDIDAVDSSGSTALHYAVLFENFDIVKLLLEKGTNINAVDYEGLTALHRVTKVKDDQISTLFPVGKNSISVARFLLEKGANINIKNKKGETALHFAVLYDNLPMVTLFLEKGANIDDADEDGKTALDIAIVHKKIDIINLLVNKGAYVDEVTRSAANEDRDILDLLEKK